MLHVPRKPPSYVRLTVPGFISRALHVGLFHFVTECLILSNRTTDLQQASQTQKCMLFLSDGRLDGRVKGRGCTPGTGGA